MNSDRLVLTRWQQLPVIMNSKFKQYWFKLLENMKTKISLQYPYLLIFYSFLKQDILYREGNEMGGPDGDKMFACGVPLIKWYTSETLAN